MKDIANQLIVLLNKDVYSIHSEHLGTLRAVSDKNSQVLWKWESDVFGDIQPKIEYVKMPLRMAGQYADEEVGLFYNYFRFYDPATGRYIENDPIDLQGGLNRYGYVGGSPLHYVDPYGEYLVGVWGAGVGATLGAGANLLTQLIQNGNNWSCVKWENVGWSALTGGIAGLALTTPMGTTWLGVTSIGAITNTLNYVLTNSPTEKGLGLAVVSGAVGGIIGGKVPNPFMFIKPSPRLNSSDLIGEMVATKTLAQGFLGYTTSSLDYSKHLIPEKAVDCECQ